MCGSNVSQKMSIAMCDRHHYTLENENVDEKIYHHAKHRESRPRQWQSASVDYIAGQVTTPGLAMSLTSPQNYCDARETGHGEKGYFYLWPIRPLDLLPLHRHYNQR